MPYSGRANTKRRVVGGTALCSFLARLRKRYDAWFCPGHRVVVVWDNWPVRYHRPVLAAAREQGIELLYTPTYAPLINPIEKSWDGLRSDLLRLHRLSQDRPALCQTVEALLAGLAPERAHPERLPI